MSDTPRRVYSGESPTIRDEIQWARREFQTAHNIAPTYLFVSPEVHTQLCIEFTKLHGREFTSLLGQAAWGMFIHLVPTLRGFSIA